MFSFLATVHFILREAKWKSIPEHLEMFMILFVGNISAEFMTSGSTGSVFSFTKPNVSVAYGRGTWNC